MAIAIGRWLAGALLLAGLLLHGAVHAQDSSPAPLPTFAELEAAGTRIGEIRVLAKDIFDTSDPREDYLLYRWANQLHIQTKPSVIRRALLFETGDAVSLQQIEETERLLRGNNYLYDVQIRPVAVRDGVVDIEVVTRDTWSLNLGASVGRSGGANSSGVEFQERNLFGTGTSIGLARNNSVDRSGNVFTFSNERAFGTWASVAFSHASNSDGGRSALAVSRPFYALDTRWTAGVQASKDDRIDAVYNAGTIASQYRHRQDQGEVFAGWSAGLVDGWVRRYTLGLSYDHNTYAAEPGLVAPAVLPGDDKRVGPFIRYQLIEDRFDRELNRNLVGRPEFFQLGLASQVQLGWASTTMGSSRNALIFSGVISRGYEPVTDHTLMMAGALSGEIDADKNIQYQVGVQAQYYLPQSKRWLFYASMALDRLSDAGLTGGLLLGGDNGMRGYPLRYQSGTRRALFTVEERFYTDWYPWRLFRVGGAAFVDVGRAWGGDNQNTANPGWLGNVGVGLRIVNTRAAFGNVLHVDIAMPLGGAADVKKTQFLVKTKTSF